MFYFLKKFAFLFNLLAFLTILETCAAQFEEVRFKGTFINPTKRNNKKVWVFVFIPNLFIFFCCCQINPFLFQTNKFGDLKKSLCCEHHQTRITWFWNLPLFSSYCLLNCFPKLQKILKKKWNFFYQKPSD